MRQNAQLVEDIMPANITLDDQVTFVTDPVNPCSGTDFLVTWQEKNVGDEASGDYQDIFDMDDQGSGDSQSIKCSALGAGESVSRSATFNLPAGNYTMSLVINGQGPAVLGNVIIADCV
ncbi:hypothetical protein [Streptomyces sp. B21-108]|jgi:hypothetical protein